MTTGRIVDVDPVNDRPGWLDWRRHGLGASDMAGVLGISRWSTPWSVFANKVGLIGEQDETEVMEAGRWLESAIGPWFSHRTGLTVAGRSACVEAPEWPVARCSNDDQVLEGPNSDTALGGLEIKTTGPGRRWEEIPEAYQAQAQWQMYVNGWERVWLAVLMGRRLDVHELDRNQADIDFMVKRAQAFWYDHVVAGVPPATDGHDATLAAIAEAYPTAVEGKSVDIDDLADTLSAWHAAKADEAAAKKRKKAAAAAIEAALGDAEEGLIAGVRVVSWREQTRKAHVVQESTFRVLRDVTSNSKEAAA